VSILEHIGSTPLVALARIGAGLPVPILAKCEHPRASGPVVVLLPDSWDRYFSREWLQVGVSAAANPAMR